MSTTALTPQLKNFWVRIVRNEPSHWSDAISRELHTLRNLFQNAGAPVLKYALWWQQDGQPGFKLQFSGIHRDAVRKVLVNCLLSMEIERCHIGPQVLSWDDNGRPFIEHPGYVCRRYLDSPSSAHEQVDMAMVQ